jgi:hypothetical protein
MTRHETHRIIVKEADVDKNIAEVVQWLNKYEDVITLYSCEGYDPGEDDNHAAQKPYILFLCFNQITLGRISEKTHTRGKIEVYWHETSLRYRLTYSSKVTLEQHVSLLKLQYEYRKHKESDSNHSELRGVSST